MVAVMNYNIYKQYLLSLGVANTRADSLADAVSSLHMAISKLDNRNLTLFMQTFGKTKGLLNAFAECERLKKFK
jgi:hypothetical protein